MEKMGWSEGQGLGAKKQGPLEPILPSIKLDTKGLASADELPPSSPYQQMLSELPIEPGQNPISLLQEYCVMKDLTVPQYELVEESGPAHNKHFNMRVMVNGIHYQPTVSSQTKKLAKHLAATVCLQAFGVLPMRPPKVQLKMRFHKNEK